MRSAHRPNARSTNSVTVPKASAFAADTDPCGTAADRGGRPNLPQASTAPAERPDANVRCCGRQRFGDGCDIGEQILGVVER